MKDLEDKFFNGRSEDAPEELVNNEVALAFYNFSKDTFDDLELLKTPFHVEVSLKIDNTVKEHIYLAGNKIIDWYKNEDITGQINIELGDHLYELHQKYGLDTNWNKIDGLIEECMKISMLTYR